MKLLVPILSIICMSCVNQGTTSPADTTGCTPSRTLGTTFPTQTAPSQTHPSFSDYSLVFSDEFSGSTIDTAVWRYDTEGNSDGWGNNERQQYTDASGKNAFIEDGALVIEAKYENNRYTSARLHTHGSKEFRYGVIEARMRMPKNVKGLWTAFWMLGDNFNGWGHDKYGGNTGWPRSGEIDIMEWADTKGATKILGTQHWQHPDNPTRHDSGRKHMGGETTIPTVSTKYHIYGIRWTVDEIIYYVDRKEYYRHDIRAAEYDEFRKSFFLLLNVAVGGNLGKFPDPKTFPQRMCVDWVRVYQKK